MRVLALLMAAAVVAAKTQEELEDEVLREAIAAGRGDRDEQGVRDQWESRSGIGGREDIRKPISRKVRDMMRDNGLECEGCDNAEAVTMVNEFIKAEQERIAAEERNAQLVKALFPVVGVLVGAVVVLGSIYLGLAIGGAGGGDDGLDDAIKTEIARKQTYAEAMAAARGEVPKAAPTWRDNEEKEEWTPRQEKQFAKALGPLLGLPPKERWPLVADQVDGKDKKECASHYKLQQILEREAAERDDTARRRGEEPW